VGFTQPSTPEDVPESDHFVKFDRFEDVLDARREVICKPWVARNGKLFAKSDFHINMRSHTIRCPAGKVERFEPGSVVEFDPEVCARCPLRSDCTMASPAAGRTIRIAHDERLQHRLRKLVATPKGRERLRERVAVEHRLAHLGRKQGRRARYVGVRKNLFDVRRAASVVNLETSIALSPERRESHRIQTVCRSRWMRLGSFVVVSTSTRWRSRSPSIGSPRA
jgi:hypothetical protein